MSISQYFARIIGAFLQESMADMVRIETMEDDQTIIMKDGTMMSMIMLQGALRTPTDVELEDMIERLRIALSPYLSTPGHMIEFNFMRDANCAREQLKEMVDRTERGSSSLGLDIGDVLEERRRVLGASMIAETLVITVYTRPDVLAREEAKEEQDAYKARMATTPVLVRSHNPSAGMDLVFTRHSAMVEAVKSAFAQVGQLCEIMDVTAVLQEMRAALYPETSPVKKEWSPRLPEWSREERDLKKMVGAPETPLEMSGVDLSPYFEPKFDRQLADRDAYVENSRVVRLGDRIFSSFDMTVPPETLPDFNDLVYDLTSKKSDLPWRASIRIEAGGMHSQQMKAVFLGIFTFSNPGYNRRVKGAIDLLREIDGQIDTVVKFRMSFSTWAEVGKADELRRNTQTLSGAVQRWGNARADGISGDQLATLLSTVPGATMASTAPVAAAPLAHAIAMSPIARQASPWEYGSILYKTDDGKPWPYMPGSSKQTTWVTLMVGTPGSGKSVAMNAINFGSIISPSAAGGKDPVLPRLAMIDIGPSSAGMISLIQEALPAHRRHEAVFRQLKMSADNAINVFDTQLGMRVPTSSEMVFLINFLSLICGNGIEAPSNAMRGLIAASVKQAYQNFSDTKNARRYMLNEEPAIDELLVELGYEAHHETVWWEIVDFFKEQGRLHEASVAQRHAVPTIADLVSASQVDQVKALYGTAIDSETGQPILNSFQRMISEIVRDYPILASHTRFSLGSARIVSLDLMHVTPGGASEAAKKQTALMYMLARQVLTRDFFLAEEDFNRAAEVGDLPEIYLDYHQKRARENLLIPKLINMDEFHRTGKIAMIIEQVLQDAREGRKFNIDIKIASQLIEDFPPSIIAVATSLFVCNAGSEQSIEYLDSEFKLTEGEKQILRYQLTGPTAAGAPVWALFKLKKEGMVRQKLNLQLGPAEIWAFSTTAKDVQLRTRLYEILGPRLTRKILARRFPKGSAVEELDAAVARLQERGMDISKGARNDVMGSLVASLEKAAYLLED